MAERAEIGRILGRQIELEQVAELLARGSEGHGGTLIIQGPAGVGKTRLLLEAERRAKQFGFAVSSFPRLTAGGLPGDGGVASLHAPLRAVSAGNAKPQLITVDNFHDVPEEFTNAVISLTHHGRTDPLMWLIGLRTHHDSRVVRRLSSEVERIAKIELGRLSDSAALELAAHTLGARLDSRLAAMVKGAGGNPLLITELVQSLHEEGSVDIADELATLTDERVPQRIQDIAHRWLDSLSEKARQLVQVAAAVGGSFMIGEVAAMLRETAGSMLPALDEAMGAGLLISPGEQVIFQHELVRRSIADALPAAVRLALSHDVEALRSQRGIRMPMSPELLVAGECAGSTPLFTQPAASAPLRVTVPMQPSGPLRSVVPAPHPDQTLAPLTGPGLACRLVPALLMARSTRTELLPMGLAAELRGELTTLLSGSAPYAEVLGAGPVAETDGEERADRIARNIVSLFADSEHRAMDRARAVLAAHTGESGEVDALTATVVMSNLEWAAGNLAEGLRWGHRAVEGLGLATPPLWVPYVKLALASKLSDVGRFEEAEALIRTAQREAEELGSSTHTAAPLVTRARLLLQSSRLQEAQDAAQTGLAAAAKYGGGWVIPVGQAVLILVALRRGDLSSASDYVWRCRAAIGADSTVFPSIHFSWGECLVATAQLSPQLTAELLTTKYVHLLTAPQLFVEEAGAAPWFVRLALEADDIPLATTVVSAAERLAAANPKLPTVAITASHARGLLERDTDALRRAAREHVSPCAGALADEDLGMLLASEEGKSDAFASRALRSALRRFELLGLQGDVDRIRAFMDENAVPAAPASAQPASAGWDALTEAERTIACLVSEGLTNRQIARRVKLSPHTVNYHLRAIFRKLNINSRVEVARHMAYGA